MPRTSDVAANVSGTLPASVPSRPDPDPTLLTTQQLLREVAAIKELFATRLEGMDKAVLLLQETVNRSPSINEVYLQHEERFKAVAQQFAERDARQAQAVATSQTNVDAALRAAKDAISSQESAIERIRTEIIHRQQEANERVAHLQALHGERFDSIATQFQERDTRTEQTSKDSKVAVDAALQAAKEAVNAQQISNALAIAKSEAATTKQIDQQVVLQQTSSKATDDKIDDLKQRLTAIEGRSKGSGESWGVIAGVVGLVLALASIVVAIIAVTHHS